MTIECLAFVLFSHSPCLDHLVSKVLNSDIHELFSVLFLHLPSLQRVLPFLLDHLISDLLAPKLSMDLLLCMVHLLVPNHSLVIVLAHHLLQVIGLVGLLDAINFGGALSGLIDFFEDAFLFLL